MQMWQMITWFKGSCGGGGGGLRVCLDEVFFNPKNSMSMISESMEMMVIHMKPKLQVLLQMQKYNCAEIVIKKKKKHLYAKTTKEDEETKCFLPITILSLCFTSETKIQRVFVQGNHSALNSCRNVGYVH